MTQPDDLNYSTGLGSSLQAQHACPGSRLQPTSIWLRSTSMAYLQRFIHANGKEGRSNETWAFFLFLDQLSFQIALTILKQSQPQRLDKRLLIWRDNVPWNDIAQKLQQESSFPSSFLSKEASLGAARPWNSMKQPRACHPIQAVHWRVENLRLLEWRVDQLVFLLKANKPTKTSHGTDINRTDSHNDDEENHIRFTYYVV